MSPVAYLLFCAQACFIQNAYSQFVGAGLGPGCAPAIGVEYELGYEPALAAEVAYGPGFGPAVPGVGYGYGFGGPAPFGPSVAYAAGPAYGGAGVGDVGVAGEMPVAGTTVVAGQVPILGAVQFTGEVPAGGVVTIAGRCGCGCNGPYMY
ncbi:chorion class CA protein ERA.2-like [Battus philenor]|uniref:chorion class CA protein ERA.2-like n=1 Tax=Battus philenor TaxID=42288 RepID=UPI0035D0484E